MIRESRSLLGMPGRSKAPREAVEEMAAGEGRHLVEPAPVGPEGAELGRDQGRGRHDVDLGRDRILAARHRTLPALDLDQRPARPEPGRVGLVAAGGGLAEGQDEGLGGVGEDLGGEGGEVPEGPVGGVGVHADPQVVPDHVELGAEARRVALAEDPPEEVAPELREARGRGQPVDQRVPASEV